MRRFVSTLTAGVAALALALTGVSLSAGAAYAGVGVTPRVLINEVYGGGGNSGAPFDRDFVELYNATPDAVNLAGWSVQYASATGSAWATTPLTGTIQPGGYFSVGEAFGSNTAAPDVPIDVDGTLALSGTAGKVALVNTSAALVGATGVSAAASVVDFVGYGPTASDSAGGAPTPAASNTASVSRSATHANTGNNAADFTAGAPSPTAGATVPEEPTDPELVTIPAIQGTGDASPLAGTTVITRGIVTAAYPTGGFSGYVLQTPGTGGALDPARTTSDAIFVFSSATVASVAVGNYVEVTGAVSEFNGLTELTVLAGGATVLPDAAAPVAPITGAWPATAAARESIESMLFAPTGAFTVSNTFSTNQFGEVGLATGTSTLLQNTEVAAPGTPAAAAVVADNVARGVVLDDGSSTNFLSAANSALTPPFISTTAPVRVGAAATLTAPVIVDFRNNVWKLNPTAAYVAGVGTPPATFENDRTAAPDVAAIGGDLKIASFNVLNYFTTLGATTPGCTSFNDRTGDPVTVNSGCDPRGAWDPADLTRQQVKIVTAINDLDADVVGLLEIENSAKVDGIADEALGTLVDALNAAAGSTVWAFVPSSTELPDPAGQDVITNALIYRTAAVTRTGPSHALGDQSDDGEAFGNAREPIAQAFTPVGGGEPILVAVNHFKSKGSAGPWPGDADTGDGQGASNESRVRQATALRDWIPTIQGSTESVALVGDFNSYSQEDPLRLLYTAGYTDAGTALAPGQYSYSFGGTSGSLDHVLLNGPALERATGADIWEINAEESIALEYSRYNYHGTLFYAPDEYRSSDHDPVIVGLVDGEAAPVDLTFLDINDFHGRIDANTVKFAGTVEQQRAAASGPVAFVSAGDNVSASLFASAVQDDQPTIDVLNALDLNASAVGNHEFDKGYADLVDRIIDGGNNAKWDYLGANVYLAGTETPALPAYSIIDMGGVSVGVVGAVTEETPSLVSPGGITELEFGDPVEAVNRVAGELTDGDPANGEADVIIASYHEGAAFGVPDGATIDQEVAAGGAFADIVTQTSAAVDAIFTGHTHKQYAWEYAVPGDPTKTRPILQTGSYGEFIGKIVLSYDPSTDEVTAHTQTNVPRTTVADADLVAAYPRVAEVKTITDAALAYAAVVGNQPVGSVTSDITTAFTGGSYVGGVYTGSGPLPTSGRDDRASESTLGNLVANALKETLAPADLGGADIGVVNPGGLRADLLYAPDGVISYAEANSVLPFVNNLWTTTLTGTQFVTMLEQQWQTNADGSVPTRPYLQLGLSDNVSYTYDPAAAQGSHITSVTINGVPLDPAGEYRLGTFSFLTTGGDNFRVVAQGTDARDSGLIDRDGWIAYLQNHPGLAPSFARHAVAVPDAPESVVAGEALSFAVSKLDLTSLGSPANTTLDILLDGTSIGSVPVSGGAATVAATIPSGTPAGAHVLTLVAAPSGTTVTLPITVEVPIPATTTTLTSDRSSQIYGASSPRVTLTATVTSSAPVSGSVRFVSGSTVLGTVALVNGKATLKLPATQAAGAYSVVATFAGSATLGASQSAPLAITVAKATTKVVLAATRTDLPRNAILPSILLVGVTQNNGQLPSGTVQIRDNGTVVSTLRVVLGVALGTVPRSTSVGTHAFTATFVPSDPANIAGATSNTVSIRIR